MTQTANNLEPPTVVPQWQLDLDRVGFVRRMFLARKWYGGDWWFVLISAILSNDTPVIMSITFVFSALVVLFNLIADLVYGWLDPRISLR